MPYEIRKLKRGQYEVLNSKTGKVHAKHTSLVKAKAQVRLLGMKDAEGGGKGSTREAKKAVKAIYPTASQDAFNKAIRKGDMANEVDRNAKIMFNKLLHQDNMASDPDYYKKKNERLLIYRRQKKQEREGAQQEIGEDIDEDIAEALSHLQGKGMKHAKGGVKKQHDYQPPPVPQLPTAEALAELYGELLLRYRNGYFDDFHGVMDDFLTDNDLTEEDLPIWTAFSPDDSRTFQDILYWVRHSDGLFARGFNPDNDVNNLTTGEMEVVLAHQPAGDMGDAVANGYSGGANPNAVMNLGADPEIPFTIQDLIPLYRDMVSRFNSRRNRGLTMSAIGRQINRLNLELPPGLNILEPDAPWIHADARVLFGVIRLVIDNVESLYKTMYQMPYAGDTDAQILEASTALVNANNINHLGGMIDDGDDAPDMDEDFPGVGTLYDFFEMVTRAQRAKHRILNEHGDDFARFYKMFRHPVDERTRNALIDELNELIPQDYSPGGVQGELINRIVTLIDEFNYINSRRDEIVADVFGFNENEFFDNLVDEEEYNNRPEMPDVEPPTGDDGSDDYEASLEEERYQQGMDAVINQVQDDFSDILDEGVDDVIAHAEANRDATGKGFYRMKNGCTLYTGGAELYSAGNVQMIRPINYNAELKNNSWTPDGYSGGSYVMPVNYNSELRSNSWVPNGYSGGGARWKLPTLKKKK